MKNIFQANTLKKHEYIIIRELKRHLHKNCSIINVSINNSFRNFSIERCNKFRTD